MSPRVRSPRRARASTAARRRDPEAEALWGDDILTPEERAAPAFVLIRVPTMDDRRERAADAIAQKKETARRERKRYTYLKLRDGQLVGERWRVVGEGPFAVGSETTAVYEVLDEAAGRDEEARRTFALKTNKKYKIAGMFSTLWEAHVLTNIVRAPHPNVHRVLASGELLSGRTVFEYNVSPLYPFTADEASYVNLIQFERDMRAAIAHLQSYGVVNGDIKPANVAWDPGAAAWVLIDFDSSDQSYAIRNADVRWMRKRFFRGTLEYATPRMLRYAFVVTFFEDEYGLLANTLDYLLAKNRGGDPSEWVNPFHWDDARKRLVQTREPGPYLAKYLAEDPIDFDYDIEMR